MLKRTLPLFILIIILFFLPFSFSEKVRDFSIQRTARVSSFLVRQKVGAQNFFSSIVQIPTLRNDKNNLQDEVGKLQQELSDSETIRRENEALRKELGVSETIKSFPKVFARVVIQGNDPLDRQFTVNAGSDQGVQVGQPVVSQGYLIGKVINVRKGSSVVRSIFSPKSQVQAWIINNREKGLLVGTGNGVYLEEITQGVLAEKDSTVETSGLGGSLPQGLIIGKIEEMTSAPSDPTQRFRISVGFESGSIESAFILLTEIPE